MWDTSTRRTLGTNRDFTNQNATQFENTETETGSGRERRHERGKNKVMDANATTEAELCKSFKLRLTHFRFIAGVIHHKWQHRERQGNVLLFAYQDGSIDDTEFALLYDLNSSENLEFPYWKYGRFDLDSMTDDECKTEFRFFKNDIYLLGEVLDIPDIMKCPNGVLITHFQKVIQP